MVRKFFCIYLFVEKKNLIKKSLKIQKKTF